MVVAEGILDPDEARAQAAEAARAGQGLLERLRGSGRISEPTFSSLRARVLAPGGLEPTVDQRASTAKAWGLAVTVPGGIITGGAASGVSGQGVTVAGGPSGVGWRVPRSSASDLPPVGTSWPGAGASADPDAFPVPGWDRYQPIRLLGQGGMGRVFLAHDLKLDRDVAIKFVRGDDPDLVRRIVAEARAQARVNHERVCQVFDVGEVAGRVYISMQAIDGQTLAELVHELTYEQKAMVLRGAALGVAEAHKAGLIHRDLKPTNIMVERTADGELRPYVMDFGVARDWTDSTTMTGTVLGTPQFMAPEQARGEVKQLDRRADVYSLGATLYTLLVDRPPHTGDNPLVILNRIALDEPPRLRSIDPDVPADLEAIVMKCLEKERAARYDSARALADDLDRFLAGEPVAARAAAGLGYRLQKTLRRRWRLVALATVMLAIVAVALGFGLRERWEAARRETIARRFTEKVERIDALARTSALARAHDLRSDRALIVAQMDAITGEMRAAGTVAAGSGHYALGRGYLALGDDERAAEELQAAWQRGVDDPRAAYARALALGHLYQRGLREVERMSPSAAAARRRELQARYRDPALGLLRDLHDPHVPSPYVAALIAFYDERYDDALRQLDGIDQTAGGMASFYEAPLLRGQILHARAVAHHDRGEPDDANTDLALGRKALAAAAAIAESEPTAHAAIAELEQTAVLIELYSAGEVEPPFARGLAAIDRALEILPGQPAALMLRARLRRLLANHRRNRGEDVTDLVSLSIADAQRAVELAPPGREGQLELALGYLLSGEVRQGQGQDPSEPLGKAIALASAASGVERDPDAQVQLGLAYKIWADYQDGTGQDAEANRGRAIEAYTRALELDPSLGPAWQNLGIIYYARASQPRSQHPTEDLDHAIGAFERSRALRPSSYVAPYYLGAVHELLAQHARAHGGDPGPELAHALEMYQAGLALNPSLPHLHNGISMVHVQQAEDAWERGDDPDPFLAQALAAADAAVTTAPAQADGYNNRGEALARRAGYQRERGQDPRALARAAAEAYGQALARAPDDPTFLLNVAGTHVLVAEYQLGQGGDPHPSLALARRAIDLAIKANPSEPDAHRGLGEVAAILARFDARHHRPADAGFDDAARSFRRAIELGPDDRDLQLGFARFCLERATATGASGAADAALREGLQVTGRVLAERPSWSTARVLAAQLQLEQAMRLDRSEAMRQAAARAATELAAATAGNPNLAASARPALVAARRFAGSP